MVYVRITVLLTESLRKVLCKDYCSGEAFEQADRSIHAVLEVSAIRKGYV